MRKNCERIIQTLDIEFINAQHGQILQPHFSKNEKIVENRLIYVHKDKMSVEAGGQVFLLGPGDVIFLSSGTVVDISYGDADSRRAMSDLSTSYLGRPIQYLGQEEFERDFDKNFSYIEFSAKAYRAIDFFQFMGLPPFVMKNNPKIIEYAKVLFHELHEGKVGKQLMLKSTIIQILVCLMRYILSPQLSASNLSEKLLVNIDALMDPRLVKIFKYIADNISGDLTNGAIAAHVGLNKDYIGQFFNNHTEMNLQTYVQMVRLNKALELLRTTEMKIQDISKTVGFSSGAYFGKQFRIVFGNPPKQLQKKYIAKL